jgi:hypothetical protein
MRFNGAAKHYASIKYNVNLRFPTNDRFDGSYRDVRVTVMPKDERKVKVFAPSGYCAVDPEKIREEKTNDN